MLGYTSAITIALAMGGDLLLPPSLKRNGYHTLRSTYFLQPFSHSFNEQFLLEFLRGVPESTVCLIDLSSCHQTCSALAGKGCRAHVITPAMEADARGQHSLEENMERKADLHFVYHVSKVYNISAARIKLVRVPSLFAKGLQLQEVTAIIKKLVLDGAHQGMIVNNVTGSFEAPVVIVNLQW
jgi:hypothetical protein